LHTIARKLASRLPESRQEQIYRIYKAAKNELDWREVAFLPGAKPCRLVTDVFDKLQGVPGYFTYDDLTHFSLLLRMQSAMDVGGDVLEIGAYYGRSAALLGHELQPGERLVICDPLEVEEAYRYPEPLTEAVLWRTISTVNPNLDRSKVQLVQSSSRELRLGPDEWFRFVHIDGSHQYEDALHDLRLAAEHTLSRGIIAVDDYEHPYWNEVTAAVEEFVATADDFVVLADLNRHAEAGRKIYLIRERARTD
jgi:predicted O-methyltransferase YrrM